MSNFNFYDTKREYSNGHHCLVVEKSPSIQCSGWKKRGNKSYIQCQTELKSGMAVYCHYDCWSLDGNYAKEFRCVYCPSCMKDVDGFTEQTDIVMRRAAGGISKIVEFCSATLHVFPNETERKAKALQLMEKSSGPDIHESVHLK